MPYEMLQKKISALPAQYYLELVDYVEFLVQKAQKMTEQERLYNEKIAALDAITGILSDEEAAEMRKHCHLQFKEIEP